IWRIAKSRMRFPVNHDFRDEFFISIPSKLEVARIALANISHKHFLGISQREIKVFMASLKKLNEASRHPERSHRKSIRLQFFTRATGVLATNDVRMNTGIGAERKARVGCYHPSAYDPTWGIQLAME